jgi:hypothetical protein
MRSYRLYSLMCTLQDMLFAGLIVAGLLLAIPLALALTAATLLAATIPLWGPVIAVAWIIWGGG